MNWLIMKQFSLRHWSLFLLVGAAHCWDLPDFMREYEATQHSDFDDQATVRDLQNGASPPKETPIVPVLQSDGEANGPPTMAPTESPAPSPSPSWTPTAGPTVTAKPTEKPSPSPTESPAPSPAPSWTPSLAPTPNPSTVPSMNPTITPVPTFLPSKSPSAVPSFVPTQFPSDVPTVSLMPSESPSNYPTDAPSAEPTVSLVPSGAPSSMPSFSNQPSSMPSHIEEQTVLIDVTLDMPQLLNFTQVKAFERGTANWLSVTDIGSGQLTSVVVQVQDQSMVLIEDVTDPTEGRKLEEMTSERKLNVDFTVSATYTGTDASFSLFEAVDPEFQSKNTLWLRYIGDEDAAFRPLNPVFAALEGTGSDINEAEMPSNGISPGALAMVLFVAIGATVLGVGASVYAVQSYRVAVYGKELSSPRSGSTVSLDVETGKQLVFRQSSSQNTNPVTSVPTSTSFGATSYVSKLTASELGQQHPEGVPPSLSQYSLESANKFEKKPEASPVYMARASRHADPHHNRKSKSVYGHGRTHKDPPSGMSDVGIGSKFPETIYEESRAIDAGATPYIPQKESFRENALMDNTSVSSKGDSTFNESELPYDMQYELMLTKSMGGTLGAAAVDGSPVHGSDFSSQANSFFASIVNKKQKKAGSDTNSNFLGGRPRQSHGESSNGSSRRAGLFDVFAPPGYIGIIVDTTKHGPVVHSLKPTSPMLGLINAGDLIVGLDDQDTRSMTAATLTKLMAKKASQKERKITLLAAAEY